MKVKQPLTSMLFYLTTKITKQIVCKISFCSINWQDSETLSSRSSLTSIIDMHVVVHVVIFWLFWIFFICLSTSTRFRTGFSCSDTGSWKNQVLTSLVEKKQSGLFFYLHNNPTTQEEIIPSMSVVTERFLPTQEPALLRVRRAIRHTLHLVRLTHAALPFVFRHFFERQFEAGEMINGRAGVTAQQITQPSDEHSDVNIFKNHSTHIFLILVILL